MSIQWSCASRGHVRRANARPRRRRPADTAGLMRIQLVPAGSTGDWLPLLRLGRALARRGHEVRAYGNGHFAALTDAHGLGFVETSDAALYRAALADPAVLQSRSGLRMIAAAVADTLQSTHEALQRDVLAGQTLVLRATLSFAADAHAEARRLPQVAVHLSPSVFRSLERPERLRPGVDLGRWPPALRATFWWLVDRLALDPLFARPLNRHRQRLGLLPLRRLFRDGLHHGQALLGLFDADWAAGAWAPPDAGPPAVDGSPAASARWPGDWPSGLQVPGFPFDDEPERVPPLDDGLQGWLRAGPPPVLVTTGTANTVSDAWLREAAAVGRRCGGRVLLVSARRPLGLGADDLGQRCIAAAPFDRLFPQLGAVVHHGGIGTTAEALRAGVPQLIRPMAYDQFDNAARTVRCGAAVELPPGAAAGPALEAALQRLSGDAAWRRHCQSLSARLQHDAIARAADLVETTAAASGPSREALGRRAYAPDAAPGPPDPPDPDPPTAP